MKDFVIVLLVAIIVVSAVWITERRLQVHGCVGGYAHAPK